MRIEGFEIQVAPRVYVATLQGKWLLERVTPSWRIKDPQKGFQRIVNEQRAQEIARTVLDRQRTFPNAIVLATDHDAVSEEGEGVLTITPESLFLVVDGQHRLWAQHFSSYDAPYVCMIHTGLSEVDMATLFVEINDNQKRVPSSLRWDLVRLVREERDPESVRATDLLFDLNTNRESPIHQRIDLTGEVKELKIKQGSLAPEIRSLIRKRPFDDVGYDLQYKLLEDFFAAVRDLDPDGWVNATSPFYANRVLRALIKSLPTIVEREGNVISEIDADTIVWYLSRIDPDTLDPEIIRGQQGSAGIAAIHKTIVGQLR